ncbi:major facilitator superfamily domain-containing protein [Aspergillus granulosus]|uniref:Major facilitator superfamily domain-containing protein n=1 Tax=Aspergillus granulosus TaxID=176169 RepID=A0ABR4HWZ8_9EURO
MVSTHTDSGQSQVEEKTTIHSDTHLKPNSSHQEVTRTEADETGGAEHGNTPMTFRRFMGFVAMAFLWTGSQIPVYLFGGIPPIIYGDIGGVDRWVWFVLANLLALAGVCPFVGSLSDLIGRRYVALIGAALVTIGMIVCTTAKDMNAFIAGMGIAGAGAGVNELTALAATAEMAPTRQRGKYVAILIFTIAPFAPSVLWAQLIADAGNWRHVGAFCTAWSGLAFLITAVFYFPPPRVNSEGLSRAEVVKRIDFIGGFLSITGLILFMAGMQWGGYQYDWDSAHVLAPLILGFLLLVAFGFWEVYGAEYPIFPSRLKQEPRTLGLTLVITFISGANFFSVLMFWPTQAFNVYGHDPVGVGIRSLPIGFGIMAGACIVLWLLSVFRGHNKELMIASSVLMTAGCGALAIAEPDNMHQLWGILVLAGLGIGGIVVPASIITTIICPDDLIATISALTLSIRVVGGSIGYTIYYNVFINKFIPNAEHYIGGVMMTRLNITDVALITEAIELTGASLLEALHHIPGIEGNQAAYDAVVTAGQIAYSESYKWVYYASIGFGGPLTDALYLDNGSLHTSTSQLISCQPVSSLDEDTKRLAKNIAAEDLAVITRQTVFYAQGGGQPSDTGFITAEGQERDGKFEVLLVRKTLDGTIFHFGRFLNTGTGCTTKQLSFAPGQTVSLAIDRKKRNYHSRLHTAGHILGLAMRLLAPMLGVREKGKANHFPGEASLEFEGLLYNEHKPIIQEKVNELVAQAIPVRVSWWEAAEVQARIDELNMAEGMQEAVGAMGKVRVAEIGDVDANPCGGTHVEHTGKTGEIKIRKIGRQKGVTRVSYEVPVDFDF